MTSLVYTKAQVDALLAAINSILGTKLSTGSLATVATSGAYSDLSGKPTIPVAAADVSAVPTSRTVNGKALTSDVTITKTDLSLGNVDNTSDLNKPLSTAAIAALAGKADYLLASGALPIRFIGAGTSLPASATDGDVFLLVAP